MMHSGDDHQDTGVQVIRLAISNKTVHITTHQDPSSGKAIVIWDDVLRVFRDARYLQHGQRVLPFMKGSDFKDLDPPRIAAIPNAVLDIVVEDTSLVDSVSGHPQDSTTEISPQSEVFMMDLPVMEDPVPEGNTVTRMLAEQGDVEAQFETGCQYESWLNPDYIQAEEWYLKAAKQGQLAAQCALGRLYEEGLGRPVDLKKASEWYHKAAEAGYSPAQTILGGWYQDGLRDVLEEDKSKSLEWYLKAAEGGNPLAQRKVGDFYGNRRGRVPEDTRRAFEWYMKAALQGNSSAQLLVAEMYHTGYEKVPRDYQRAKEWYLKAAKSGQRDAYDCLDLLEKQIFQQHSPGQQQHEL